MTCSRAWTPCATSPAALPYAATDGLTHISAASGAALLHDDTLTLNGDGARTGLSDSVSGTILSYGVVLISVAGYCFSLGCADEVDFQLQ